MSRISEAFKTRINPMLIRSLGVAPAPSTRFLMGQRLALFKSLNVAHVLDVGANIGQYASELRLLGFAGRIESFEPMREAFDQLSKSAARDDAWRVHHTALGTSDGAAVLHTWSGSAGESSSLQQPSSDLVALLGDPTDESVPTTSLDAWAKRYPDVLTTPSWLKIDTQGSELEVLRGASHSLPHIVGLEIEMPLRHWYEGGPTFESLLSAIRELGFTPASIMTERFRREWNGAVDVDALFIRR